MASGRGLRRASVSNSTSACTCVLTTASAPASAPPGSRSAACCAAACSVLLALRSEEVGGHTRTIRTGPAEEKRRDTESAVGFSGRFSATQVRAATSKRSVLGSGSRRRTWVPRGLISCGCGAVWRVGENV